jgi:hypothetical protein
MKPRTDDRRIARALGLILMTMAVSTVGFVLVGSTDPRTQLMRGPFFTPERPYPWPAVAMSGLSVVTEGVLLWLVVVRVRAVLALRFFAGGVVAMVAALRIDPSAFGWHGSRGYISYHLLWLRSVAVLMLALLLVVLVKWFYGRLRIDRDSG